VLDSGFGEIFEVVIFVVHSPDLKVIVIVAWELQFGVDV